MDSVERSVPGRWARPVPQIGDASSAAQRAAAPDGWAFPVGQQGLFEVMAARRDIRRYRAEAVPEELIRKILEAGHQAPSVGHSQPWRFIIVDDKQIRDQAAVMADRERLRQADLLTPERREKLLDLQLEGIREAPLGIVVACDRRTPSSGVLGRNTFTDADMWSCACAVQNIWLAARAYGLGMGWVTLFRPDELAELLGLPENVETLGWLCLGWPDERPPEPGLQRRAWSKRLALDDLISRNRWPDAPASAPVNGLAKAPDQTDVVAAHDAADLLLTPPGSLGILDNALDKVIAAGGGDIDQATMVLVGADHPVAARGVSAFHPAVTREVLQAAVAGEALGVTMARQCGITSSLIVDAGLNGAPLAGAIEMRASQDRGDLSVDESGLKSAMTLADTQKLIEAGRGLVAGLAPRQLICLGEVGVANTTPAVALACTLTGLAAQQAVGMGASSDSAMVERKIDVVSVAVQAALAASDDPLDLLAALGGPEFAVLTGVIQQAAADGHLVVLDGLATSVPALIAVALEPAIQSRLIAGHCSREYAHHAVLTDLGLEPLLRLRLRAGEGVGACLGARMLLAGLATRRLAGRTG